MKPFVVVIDPGHGGDDPGAVAGGAVEARINLDVAQKLSGILGARYGVPNCLTRCDDRETVSLNKRVELAHNVDASLLISIHCNAAASPAANGFEIYTSLGLTRSDAFATAIGEAWREEFPTWRTRWDLDDGDLDKEENFYVLRRTMCPAVLIELGFLTHEAERARLTDPNLQQLMAAATAQGIVAGLSEQEA